MTGSDVRLYFSEKERCNVWKDYIEWSMKEKMIRIIMWKEMQ